MDVEWNIEFVMQLACADGVKTCEDEGSTWYFLTMKLACANEVKLVQIRDF